VTLYLPSEPTVVLIISLSLGDASETLCHTASVHHNGYSYSGLEKNRDSFEKSKNLIF